MVYTTTSFLIFSFFFFNATATPEIYTLSLHDALPIFLPRGDRHDRGTAPPRRHAVRAGRADVPRSEEHTSELQSRFDLVCRLLLEKKKHDWYSSVFVISKLSECY